MCCSYSNKLKKNQNIWFELQYFNRNIQTTITYIIEKSYPNQTAKFKHQYPTQFKKFKYFNRKIRPEIKIWKILNEKNQKPHMLNTEYTVLHTQWQRQRFNIIAWVSCGKFPGQYSSKLYSIFLSSINCVTYLRVFVQ